MQFDLVDDYFEENKDEIKEKAAIALKGSTEDFITLAVGDESMREILRAMGKLLEHLPKYKQEEKIQIIKIIFSAILLDICTPEEVEDIINSLYSEIINLYYTDRKLRNLL